MTSDPVWTCERSVDVDVPAAFAWQFMTDVRNWSDPPAEFTLDGPFAAGTRGATSLPGQPRIGWIIRTVDPGRSYTIDASGGLENAWLLFHWEFDAVSAQQTRLTQRVELSGENGGMYVNDVRAFETNLESGMRRIAAMMVSRAGPNS